MKTYLIWAVSATLLLGAGGWAQEDAADQPQAAVSFQGTLEDKDGNPAKDGKYTMRFALFVQANGGDPVWEDTATVDVKNGRYFIILGDKKPLGVQFNKPLWVEKSVVNASFSGQMTRDRVLLLVTDGIETQHIKDGAVTPEKLAGGGFLRLLSNDYTASSSQQGDSEVILKSVTLKANTHGTDIVVQVEGEAYALEAELLVYIDGQLHKRMRVKVPEASPWLPQRVGFSGATIAKRGLAKNKDVKIEVRGRLFYVNRYIQMAGEQMEVSCTSLTVFGG